jgi:hypothetical protein
LLPADLIAICEDTCEVSRLTHHATVIDEQGRLLADAQFTADTAGYRQLRRRAGRLRSPLARFS